VVGFSGREARTGWWARAGLLLGAVLLLLGSEGAEASPTAAAAAAVRTHEGRYRGRYRHDPRFEQTFGALELAVARALVVIEDRLGIGPRADARIHVYVQDADPQRFGHDRARCRTHRVGKDEYQHVDLYTEYFVSGDADLQTVVTHELVHAVMRARLGRRRYERLPHWLREGLAVHVADEGERHLHRTLLACEQVDALMTGLGDDTRSVRMYPYAWLAIEHMEARGGPTSLRRLVRGLVDGRDLKTLIGRIHGDSWSAFERAVRAHARTRIGAAAQGLADIKRARRLYRAKHYTRARAACGAFLKDHAKSAFAPTARYVRARCWFRDGRFDRAEAGFRECLAQDGGRSGWVDECHLFLGIALCEQARAEEGLVMLRAYLDLHPYATQRDLGLLALGRALRTLDRTAESRRAFQGVADMRAARAAHRAAAARELAREQP